MDILKAEIARKRKLLEEKNILDNNKKYFKRGELLEKEKEEYLKKYGPQSKEPEHNKEAEDKKEKANKQDTNETEQKESVALPRAEVIKRLRERGHPILLYGESEVQAFKRLRRIEIQEPEANRGLRNDFQEAMEKVDQAYLNEILELGTQNDSEKSLKEDALDDSITYEFIQEMAKTMGQGDRNHDMNVIMTLLQFLLKMWGAQLNSATAAEKTTVKHKMARATYTQTQVYLKPLTRKLKKKTLPEDICDSLMEITKHLLERNYIMASDAYLQMAIGNAPWPIGVTMVGIHARTGREKIFSKNVAHVMNDETQRKYIQALKRLMTKCQEYFPTDPSRCVEYILKSKLNAQRLKNLQRIKSKKKKISEMNCCSFLKLFETYPDIGDKVLCSPIQSLPACNRDIIKAQQNILEQDEHKSLLAKLEYHFLKRNVHARFFGLPVCPELHRTIFPKNVDLGCFLKVTGTVVRVTQSKMLEYQRKYVCVKCKYENCIEADFENRYILKAPSKCGNDESRCKSSTFTQVNLVSREHCKDYQEIKIQEQVNKLNIGTIPGSMWVVLEDDLVDSCKPGDDVNICGTVRRRWRPSVQTKKSEVELVLQANYLEVCNAQRSEVIATAPDIKNCFDEYWEKFQQCPLKGRDQILQAVCPQVYGLHLVKLAVLLTVITGSDHAAESEAEKKCSQDDKHTTRVRGQCHLLLVGDPGTGKSQLLRAGVALSARSVFTSGAGSTRAGLTCAALREEGEWQLEAGALVLSDGGVCCIDEIGQLREHDRTAIHEAMEQQTISIAKAGIVCKLNTRCAVIAACNPKGRYETDQPLSANVSLGTPLLSRFDLIFILLDSKNKTWDKLVSSYILFGDSNSTESKKQWTIEKLQMYIGLVGPRCTEITKSANIILQSYYMLQRKSEYRDPSRTTVRMLDSLVRLSQAHCRLMYRTTILPMDAIIAVSLVDLSMQDCTLNDTVDALHSTFQKYPDFDYLCTAKKVLTRLKLYEIWQQELLYYGKLLQVDHKTLEADVDRGNTNVFTKFDDVSDDNIPLSASLITSSYFNNKKNTKHNDDFDINHDENLRDENTKPVNVVGDKLVATLKKHATLNKAEKKPPIVQRKHSAKRKRKEVTIETSFTKKPKHKKTRTKDTSKEDNMTDSDDDNIENITSNMLNAIPSVNDFFAELDIDLKYNSGQNDMNNENVFTSTQKVKASNSKENGLKENRTELNENKQDFINHVMKEEPNASINSDESLNISTDSARLKTISKLKQFQFVQNHDLSKYEERIEQSKAEKDATNVSILENVKDSSNNSSMNRKSVPSSQISIFESSDCDIDLDI
ncbi:DNA helicase MCM9 [Pectinophora gossypiella]|uniref:DNA helicase MCM9 n=1 Tax=Pectinophora gossypiella TaxID=13191 RepID=UPI00214F2A40|nr:DNA helicase MCM9 [Pectinophora gossypiella]